MIYYIRFFVSILSYIARTFLTGANLLGKPPSRIPRGSQLRCIQSRAFRVQRPERAMRISAIVLDGATNGKSFNGAGELAGRMSGTPTTQKMMSLCLAVRVAPSNFPGSQGSLHRSRLGEIHRFPPPPHMLLRACGFVARPAWPKSYIRK